MLSYSEKPSRCQAGIVSTTCLLAAAKLWVHVDGRHKYAV